MKAYKVAFICLRAEPSWVRIPLRASVLFPPQNIQTFSGAHQPSYSVCTRGFSPCGVKQSNSKADQSLPSNAEVQNKWRYASIPMSHHNRVCGPAGT
jgi:hypothetical protein